MSHKNLVNLILLIIPTICFIIIIGIVVHDILKSKKILGRHKYNISIFARVLCIIISLVFFIFFNWKFTMGVFFIGLYYELQLKWKNYGK